MTEQRYLVVDIGCFECASDIDEAVKPLGIHTRAEANGLDTVIEEFKRAKAWGRTEGWEEVNGALRCADGQGGVWAFPLPDH